MRLGGEQALRSPTGIRGTCSEQVQVSTLERVIIFLLEISMEKYLKGKFSVGLVKKTLNY